MSPRRDMSQGPSALSHDDDLVPLAGRADGAEREARAALVVCEGCVALAGMSRLEDVAPPPLPARRAGETDLVSDAGETCAIFSFRSCRRSILTAANKTKTAAAARPKPNDNQLYGVSVKCRQLGLASDKGALQGLPKASSMRSNKIGDGCAGRSFLSSFSSSEKSFIAVANFFSGWPRHSDSAMRPCSERFPARCRSR